MQRVQTTLLQKTLRQTSYRPTVSQAVKNSLKA